MPANTQIGESGVQIGESEYIFRPSFLAIQSIGEPEFIIEALNTLSSDSTKITDAIALASLILDRTCTTKLPDNVPPQVVLSYDGTKELIRPGLIPVSAAVTIAIDVLAMGVCGKSKKFKENKSGKKMTSFDATQFVGCVIAQLGISPSEAWGMTMIEMQRAFESKFPGLYVDESGPSAEDYNRLVKEIERRKSLANKK